MVQVGLWGEGWVVKGWYLTCILRHPKVFFPTEDEHNTKCPWRNFYFFR